MKRLGILLTILFSIGCGTLPDPPKGYLCVVDIVKDRNGRIDVVRSAGVCSRIKSKAKNKSKYTTRDLVESNEIDIPLADLDKFVSFSPRTWGNIVEYINELKRLASQRCQ